jgi:HPt (histidine-containing phosphotransfer) domain-containing protein
VPVAGHKDCLLAGFKPKPALNGVSDLRPLLKFAQDIVNPTANRVDFEEIRKGQGVASLLTGDKMSTAGFYPDIATSIGPLTGIEPTPGRHWSLPAELMDLEDSGNEILSSLINLFINDTDKRLSALSTAQGSWDCGKMRSQAHAMKGSSIQMGAARLALDCAALEMAARDQQTNCGLLFADVAREYKYVRLEMESYLSRG